MVSNFGGQLIRATELTDKFVDFCAKFPKIDAPNVYRDVVLDNDRAEAPSRAI
jgi:hypothetical protein